LSLHINNINTTLSRRVKIKIIYSGMIVKLGPLRKECRLKVTEERVKKKVKLSV
jgi:hypothetical protein